MPGTSGIPLDGGYSLTNVARGGVDITAQVFLPLRIHAQIACTDVVRRLCRNRLWRLLLLHPLVQLSQDRLNRDERWISARRRASSRRDRSGAVAMSSARHQEQTMVFLSLREAAHDGRRPGVVVCCGFDRNVWIRRGMKLHGTECYYHRSVGQDERRTASLPVSDKLATMISLAATH